MGCGDSKEKIEDEMIKLKFQRAQIQMERKKQIKLDEKNNYSNIYWGLGIGDWGLWIVDGRVGGILSGQAPRLKSY